MSQIDRRYSLHAEQLVTRGDLRSGMAALREDMADLRTELRTETAGLRTEMGCVGSIFASVGMFAGVTRLLAH